MSHDDCIHCRIGYWPVRDRLWAWLTGKELAHPPVSSDEPATNQSERNNHMPLHTPPSRGDSE